MAAINNIQNTQNENNDHNTQMEVDTTQQLISQQIINVRSSLFVLAQHTQDQIDQILAPLTELTEALHKFQRQMQITIQTAR